jgi:hypothetical protein
MFKRIGIIQWFQNMTAPGSNPASGAYLYGEGGQIKVRQADGTLFALAPPAAGSTQIWQGGSASTTYTNSTPAIKCGGAS